MDKDGPNPNDGRSGYSQLPPESPEHSQSSDNTQQSDQSAPAATDPHHSGSDSDDDSLGGIFVSTQRTQIPPVGPSPPISAPSDGSGGDKPNRPILRLAMLNAQEKANVRNQLGHDSFTAPVHSEPIELP
ncbi:hypothetical protein EC988_007782, partial [Linderina pennispora]